MWNTQQTIEKAEETLQNIKPEYKKLLRIDFSEKVNLEWNS